MEKNSLVLCFGEIMMRLSPKDYLRLEQATEFDVQAPGHRRRHGGPLTTREQPRLWAG